MGRKVVAVFGMSFHPSQGRYLRVRNQLRALAAAGYDVLLLAWDRECRLPEQETCDGFRVLRIRLAAPVGAGPRRNALNVVRFNLAVERRLMTLPVDVVHCFNLDAILASFLAARRRGARSVLDLCEPEYYALWSARYRFLLGPINALELALARRFDQVFVHNRFQVARFRRAGIEQLTQIGSYPNRDMVPAVPTGSGGERFVIGRLGTIYEDNGIEEILEAYRLLLARQRERGGPQRFHLFLAGRVFDRYAATFARLLTPFQGQITVQGSFDAGEMAGLYAGLDLSLVLARRTRWFRNITPTKLFDSMACGVPVVASEIGDVKEILDEGQCGLTVDERDARGICEAIETIALAPGLRDRMARNAVRVANERYTWEAYEPLFLERYAQVTSSGRRSGGGPGVPGATGGTGGPAGSDARGR